MTLGQLLNNVLGAGIGGVAFFFPWLYLMARWLLSGTLSGDGSFLGWPF